jgi:hypothetical protein
MPVQSGSLDVAASICVLKGLLERQGSGHWLEGCSGNATGCK